MNNKKKKISIILSMSLLINNLPIIAEESVGWNNNNGIWSYVKEDGSKAIGWIKDGNCWYAFDENGTMRTGWVASHEHWYYMGESGVMQAGAWVDDNGAKYYIKGTGVMAKDYVKDGYELTSDGKAVPFSETGSVLVTDSSELEGKVIEGNLYVDVTTAKELELKGVTVKGKLVVLGDNKTAGKVTLTDSTVETINIQSRNAEVVLSGKTEVKNVVIEETAKVTPDKNYKGEVENIEVQSTTKGEVVIEVPADNVSTRTYATVDVQAPVGNLEVKTDTQVKVNADVKNVSVTETATGSTINVAKDVVIENVDAKADTEIKGEGKVENVSGDVTDSTTKEEKPTAGGGGGGGGSTTVTPVLSIAESDMNLHIGDVIQLNASVKPLSSNQKITWESSNKDVAEVNEVGFMTAKNIGTCIITASDTYGNQDSINIIVDSVKMTSLKPYIDKNTVVIGAKIDVYYEYDPDNATNTYLKWTSDKPDIADFDEDGYLIAKSEGTAIIKGTAQDNSGLEAIYTLEVIKPTVSVDISSILADSHITSVNNFENPFTLNRVLDKDWIKSSVEGIDSGESRFEFTVNGKGYLLFDYLLSSEKFDSLVVDINEKKVEVDEPLTVNGSVFTSFTGIKPVTRQFELPLDVNTVKISYKKDKSFKSGLDALWMNNFRFVDENSPEKRSIKVNYNAEKGKVTLINDANPEGIEVVNNQDYLVLMSNKITLKAEPIGDRAFMGWYENDTLYSKDKSITFDALVNKHLEARFYDYAKLPQTIMVERIGTVSTQYDASDADITIEQNAVFDIDNEYRIILGAIEDGTTISADINGQPAEYQNNILVISQPKDKTIITLTATRDGRETAKRVIIINIGISLKDVVSEGNVSIDSVSGKGYSGFDWILSTKIFNDEQHLALIPNEVGKTSRYENLVFTTSGSGILCFDYKTDFNKSSSYIMLDSQLIKKTDRDKQLSSSNIWTTYMFPVDSEGQNSVYLAYYHLSSETGVPAVKNVRFLQGEATVDFKSSDDSLGNVSASYIKGGNVLAGEKIAFGKNLTFKATANQDVLFMGWINEKGEILSYAESFTMDIIEDIKIQALFVEKGLYVARVGSQAFTSFEDAFAYEGEENVVLIDDVTLGKDLIIPEGKTLVIPYMSGDEGYNARNESKPEYNPDGNVTDRKEYKTLYQSLTVPEGITLEVQGTLIVNAITGRAASGHYDMDNTGGYGQLNLNGELVINGNGIVDVAGFVKGKGKVLVKENAVLRDLYVVKNWRGGTQASHVVLDYNVYPMNEADCQNIEVLITIEDNGKYIGIVKMYASGSFNKTKFPIIDRDNGLIRLANNADIQILRDNDNLRTTFEITGGALASNSTLNIVGFDLSTGTFLYPIDGDITYRLNSGMYIFENDFKFLTGSELYVNNDAEVVLNEENTLVFYDEFNDVQNTSTTKYPDRPSAFIHFAENSLFKINGKFAGDIRIDHKADELSPVIVETGVNAEFVVTTKEANGYTNGVVELRFEALVNGNVFSFETGKRYEFFYDTDTLMVKVDGFTKSISEYQANNKEVMLFNEKDDDAELSDIVE